MATEEIASSIRAADRHLKDAEAALHNRVFYDCVFHSASAAENAANALILELGGRVPRAHRDAEAIERIASRVRPEWLEAEDFRLMLKKMKELQRHVVISRYPIEVEEGKFLPPHEYYKEKDARQALEDAKFVVSIIRRLITFKFTG